jgi:hypothetical protein
MHHIQQEQPYIKNPFHQILIKGIVIMDKDSNGMVDMKL